ncbi:MAG TPA: hypothetical protein VHK24_03815 [Steroidobacter sp.]|jgi:hypothetical protein|nr:hypothetical protein [Steroidobacter sp.]
MLRTLFLYTLLLLFAGAASAEEAAPVEPVVSEAKASEAETQSEAAKSGKAENSAGAKTLSGMSILGNQEAPKALVIVPWKSSQLGDEIGLSQTLDDARRPVDKDVFLRELDYYEIRSGSK